MSELDWDFIDITNFGMSHSKYICQIVVYDGPVLWNSTSRAIAVLSGRATIEQLVHFSSYGAEGSPALERTA